MQVRDIEWLDTLGEARREAVATDKLILVMGLINGMGRDDMW